MTKRLYKSRTNKKLCGVCGGIAEYFDVDPTLVRLIFVAIFFMCGGGLLAYIVAAVIMDEAPSDYYNDHNNHNDYYDQE